MLESNEMRYQVYRRVIFNIQRSTSWDFHIMNFSFTISQEIFGIMKYHMPHYLEKVLCPMNMKQATVLAI